LIEPFGICSNEPSEILPEPGVPSTMQLKVEWCVPLKQALGISSNFVAQMIVDSTREGMWDALGNPELLIWNGIDGEGGKTPFADGAGVDNVAIHALLRRGTNKILSCYSNFEVWNAEY